MRKLQNLTATLVVASAALVLSACGKPQPTDSLESLMADPERLKLLREQCKTERTKLESRAVSALVDRALLFVTVLYTAIVSWNLVNLLVNA